MNKEIIISVIVPVYNDPKGIQTTLESLVEQSYDDYEIIPVDNNSSDHTLEEIHRFENRYPDLIHSYEETDVQSSYAARNKGIRNASGEFMAFIDANMWVDTDWITKILNFMEEQKLHYAGCRVKSVPNSNNDTIWGRYDQLSSFPVKEYIEKDRFAPTCSLIIREEVINDVGVFDQRLESNGDKEFGKRVFDAGFEQGFIGDATTYHPVRNSFDELYSKAQRIGRGQSQVWFYHSDDIDCTHPFHPTRFLPPNPVLFREYYRKTSGIWSMTIFFYLITYFLKMTETLSCLNSLSKMTLRTQ